MENLDLNMGKPNCTGSITVYTKSRQRGDSLTTEESLHQVSFGKVYLFTQSDRRGDVGCMYTRH
jgi:hypothetical protein